MTSPLKPQLTVLIVEDERTIRRFVRTALERDGHRVHEAETLAQGLLDAGTRQPDLVILDLGLPDGNGMDFIRNLRAWTNRPIMVLSARVEDYDKVAALDAGADDYLSKPFSVMELLARVRAVCRRQVGAATAEAVVCFGEVRIDWAHRTVTRANRPVHLTPIEFRLLAALLAQPGKVLTHRQLLCEVWGPAYVERGHYLRLFMSQLRQKLEANPARPRYLRTEMGVGYRFSPG
ncbi:response regulator in two-component regulatory system with KdpD, regulation of potassium translocation (OmpR family) [Candidatus Competibacter denitrificans Run_A_D11]|uniref:Response regulator in two-component regulatory system with KdpD, regulation of potassium translocation (OmpR family) n=1 Tax=Candidatus Competibacter denitrificans Run_A_D11 TaxID=1400863 RepID=W6M2W4_9GAMM|nr:two-component system response regulator KdpE [Candidatus Competibacter denitrificans]CDI00829.1 response regulator in two-component regulatory system with KdpD, regulation of potassium translocation (OmpR family) [Candidatus Competibacter denitrificans Run_A_D11]